MKDLTNSLKYLKYLQKRTDVELLISGVGIREMIRPVRVSRPAGTLDRFLLYMHTPSELDLGNGWQKYPAGTLVLWKDRNGHFYGNSSSPWVHSWLHFHGTFADHLLEELSFPEQTALYLPDFQKGIDLLTMIYHECVETEPSKVLQKLWLEGLFRELKRESERSPHADHLPGLVRLKQFLDSGLSRIPDVKEMAEYSGYSSSHLSALFRKYYHCSPAEYVRLRQMQRAAYELLNLELSVSEISDRCGFSSIYQFSRAFRNIYGISPAKWRRSRSLDLIREGVR